jgi:hypothetical protein
VKEEAERKPCDEQTKNRQINEGENERRRNRVIEGGRGVL